MTLLELTRMYYPSVGGMERSIRDRARIYEALGIKYRIVSTDYTTEKRGSEENTSSVTFLKQYTPYNITPGLRKYLTDGYDIISVNLIGRYYSDYAIYRYADKKQKIILTPYYTYHTDRLSLLKSMMSNYLFPYLISKVNAIVAFTQIEKDYWMKRYHVNGEKIFVIPPMVEQYPESIIKVPSNQKNKYLVYIGRVGQNKKTDLLIESFLKTGSDDYSLVMTIRKEDVRKDLRLYINEINRIYCVGYINESEKQKLISESEGVIFPTSWESFGYAAFEAGAAKLPLLCSDLPVLKESLNEKGVIYFKNTVEDITAAIHRFCRLSSEDRILMGKSNYENLKYYSMSEATKKYKQMFNSLMGN